MILADKIISLRKKSGMSQDELAGILNVTRQSVSKWEGAQSVPDMERIVAMSRLFGVTTDFLLKDELEFPEPAPSGPDGALRRVTLEDASAYLELRRAAAPKIALATFMCIVSPAALILLAGLSDMKPPVLSGNAAAGVGLCVLLVLVAAAVSIFIRCAQLSADFDYLEKEPFETAYGVESMVRERKKAFRETASRLNMLGTVLCILSVLPLFLSIAFFDADIYDIYIIASVCLLLLLAAFGCYAFVYAGVNTAAEDKLLQEGDYTRKSKRGSAVMGAVSCCYWLVVTAVYLLCTFGPDGGGQPEKLWYIWAVAGVLYGAVASVVNIIRRSAK